MEIQAYIFIGGEGWGAVWERRSWPLASHLVDPSRHISFKQPYTYCWGDFNMTWFIKWISSHQFSQGSTRTAEVYTSSEKLRGVRRWERVGRTSCLATNYHGDSPAWYHWAVHIEPRISCPTTVQRDKAVLCVHSSFWVIMGWKLALYNDTATKTLQYLVWMQSTSGCLEITVKCKHQS